MKRWMIALLVLMLMTQAAAEEAFDAMIQMDSPLLDAPDGSELMTYCMGTQVTVLEDAEGE